MGSDRKRDGLFGVRARLKRALSRERRPSGPARVRFEGVQSGVVEVEVEAGETLLSAALALNLDVNHYCGGHCSCGTCRVEVVSGSENLSKTLGNEEMVLGSSHHSAGDRLACQARAHGPVVVRIPEWF
jgi:ferredoxin